MQHKASLDICLTHTVSLQNYSCSHNFQRKSAQAGKKPVKMHKNYFYEVYNGHAVCQKNTQVMITLITINFRGTIKLFA